MSEFEYALTNYWYRSDSAICFVQLVSGLKELRFLARAI